VYVRHALGPGFELEKPTQGFEKFRDGYLFPIEVAGGGSATLTIEESTPIKKTVDIRTTSGAGELEVYLRAASGRLDPEMRARLDHVVEMHRAMTELEEQRQTALLQTHTYRERIDELNVQLVSPRRVAQARALSQNLARKMDDISQRLQKLTIQIADLDGRIAFGILMLLVLFGVVGFFVGSRTIQPVPVGP
jgi:hypothetical protein